MALFDEEIAKRFEDQIGSNGCSSISYSIHGSSDGIAFNKDGTAFAQVDLVVTKGGDKEQHTDAALLGASEEETKLMTSVVTFHFAPQEPNKIRSISWCVLNGVGCAAGSHCGSVNGSKSESSGKESLESQTVYPSVVSLDPMLNGEGASSSGGHHQDHTEHTAEDPGMNI